MTVVELHDTLATLIQEGEADLDVVFETGERDYPVNVVSIDVFTVGEHRVPAVVLEDGDWSGG